MAIKKIRTGDDPVLRQKAKPVEKIDERIERLINNMLDTMYDAEGIGLAAPQIGISKRVIVIDIGEDGVYKLLNPEISSASQDKVNGYEGCLSFPGLQGEVERPESVTITAQDFEQNGESVTIEAEGLLARVLCHEIDHLEGITFVDKAENVLQEQK